MVRIAIRYKFGTLDAQAHSESYVVCTSTHLARFIEGGVLTGTPAHAEKLDAVQFDLRGARL